MQNGTPKILCCKRGGSLVSLASPAIRGLFSFAFAGLTSTGKETSMSISISGKVLCQISESA